MARKKQDLLTTVQIALADAKARLAQAERDVTKYEIVLEALEGESNARQTQDTKA